MLKQLVALLRHAGHEIQIPEEAGTSGFADDAHLQFAKSNNLVVLTRDADDFAQLHANGPDHSGIFAICQDSNHAHDMSYADIVRAIQNLVDADVPIQGQFHVLNAWRD